MARKKDNKGRILKDNENQMSDGRYRYRWIDASGKRRAIYSWKLVSTDRVPNGKRDCESLREKEKAIEADSLQGIDSFTKTTLNDVWEIYFKGKTLKESTKENQRYMYDHFVKEKIGNKKISSFKYSDIKAFYNYLVKDRGLKINTLENVNTILHPTFTLAVKDGFLRYNPTEGVLNEIKKANHYEKPKRHALTIEEQHLFIEFLKQSEIFGHWLPLFTFLLGTGCRISEVLGLTWNDISLKKNEIYITHNLIYRRNEHGQCRFWVTTPKTNSGIRTIPMLDEVRHAILEERKRQIGEGKPQVVIEGYTDFVFTNQDGRPYMPQSINKAIERIVKYANEWELKQAEAEQREAIQIRPFSAHNLRHTFCTRFCENETNVKVIQDIMGHADITTTMNIYAEASEDKKKESMNALQGKIKIG